MQDLNIAEERLINDIERYVAILKSKGFQTDAIYWKDKIDIIYGRRIIRQGRPIPKKTVNEIVIPHTIRIY